MIKNKISDTGYVDFLDGKRYCYSCIDHLITLLPATADIEKIQSNARRFRQIELDLPAFVYGFDKTYHRVAFYVRDITTSIFGFPSIEFFSALLIKSTGNLKNFFDTLTDEWNKFEKIIFTGDILNSVFNPKENALDLTNLHFQDNENEGARTIDIKPFSEYTHEILVTICGHNATLCYSVGQLGDPYAKSNPSLGALGATVSLTFAELLDFKDILPIYETMTSVIAIMVGQRNFKLELALSQVEESGKYNKTAICDLYQSYEDHFQPHSFNVLSFKDIHRHLPKLFDLIENDSVTHFLALLHESNKDAHRISIYDVQNICTAFEVEYNFLKIENPQNPKLEELKEGLKEVVDRFINENSDFQPYETTNIRSSIENVDLSLKRKVLYLYDQNKEILDEYCEKKKICILDEERVQNFVNLRNNKAHTGRFEWGDNGITYEILFVLIYICVLKRVGMNDSEVGQAIAKLF